MWNFINHLQRKPEGARRRILLGASFGIFLVIFLFWLTSFKFNNNEGDANLSDPKRAESPISAIRDSLGNVFSNLEFNQANTDKALEATSSQEFYSATSSNEEASSTGKMVQ